MSPSDDTRPLTATAAQLREVLGVNPSTLRVWVHRGYVRRYGRDTYDVGDVLRRVST